MNKQCTVCGETKGISQFRVQKDRATHRRNCKACDTLRHKEWRGKNRERLRAYDNTRYRAKQDRWAAHILRKYNLTPDDYKRMLEHQYGQCAICKTEEPGGNSKRFHIDHDHKTGNVRGLLCSRCNKMIGIAGDDLSVLRGAIEYLVAPQAKAFIEAYMEISENE